MRISKELCSNHEQDQFSLYVPNEPNFNTTVAWMKEEDKKNKNCIIIPVAMSVSSVALNCFWNWCIKKNALSHMKIAVVYMIEQFEMLEGERKNISKLHSVKTDPIENRDRWLTMRTDTFPFRLNRSGCRCSSIFDSPEWILLSIAKI